MGVSFGVTGTRGVSNGTRRFLMQMRGARRETGIARPDQVVGSPQAISKSRSSNGERAEADVPVTCLDSGSEGFVDETAARDLGLVLEADWPYVDRAGRKAQPFEGFAEGVLRMAGGVSDGGPAFCSEIWIDAGKNDQPARQGEGGFHQAARGGACAGRRAWRRRGGDGGSACRC